MKSSNFAKFEGSNYLLGSNFLGGSLNPGALRVGLGPQRAFATQNLSPPRVLGQGIMSYLFGNGIASLKIRYFGPNLRFFSAFFLIADLVSEKDPSSF